MEIIGYISFIIMGIVLGLIGGGGSILTVPILVYILGSDPVLATSYSLFIVGVSAAIGSIQFFRNKLVDIKAAIVFSIPSLIAVFLTRAYLMPSIPDSLINTSGFVLDKPLAILLLFAILMLAASFSMIKSGKSNIEADIIAPKFNYPMIFIEGFVVGVLTGLVGAGGGFLIIPALVILAKIPMKMAVGTSLVIIAVKSIIGFSGDMMAEIDINWMSLIIFTGISIIGMLIGTILSKKIPGSSLKKGFGYFVLIMGIFIIIKELFLN
ncbi:MAG: sulfite exporter TauE/SafE family protein [Candidatus Kapabacteria bacterium]|nr:sulfite exporter TauE/SafE family protein [Ignavibacteriota bacterium]MCW5884821.1 sulfite exporter TauE/SafE family protein [Candidatus Kapabacteria bacterium]